MRLIPEFSNRRQSRSRLESRAGGGGSGRGASGASSVRIGVRVSGTNGRTASSTSGGSKSTSKVPSGQPFAGRTQGGGTRHQIYGTSIYGSGYPGLPATSYGTRGLGFPFFFWPLAWSGVATYAGASYMYNDEYGSYDNSSRPGGIMTLATYPSQSTSATYRLVADEMTVTSLIESIHSNCSWILSSGSSISPKNYDPNAWSPKPEQAIQYYRASSAVLTMDGYNNAGAAEGSNAPPTPLPPYVDQPLLDCLNYTIGIAAPLIDPEEGGGLSTGAIISIVLGSLAGAVFIGFMIWYAWSSRVWRSLRY